MNRNISFRMAVGTQMVTNNPNISHWHRDHLYSGKMLETAYPFRVFNTRQDGGLSVFAQLVERDIDFVCKGPVCSIEMYSVYFSSI